MLIHIDLVDFKEENQLSRIVCIKHHSLHLRDRPSDIPQVRAATVASKKRKARKGKSKKGAEEDRRKRRGEVRSRDTSSRFNAIKVE